MNTKLKLTAPTLILIIFGLLDAISFFRAIPFLYKLIYSLFTIDFHTWKFVALFNVLYIILALSFAFSAYGFIRQRRWAFILYYSQIPFRILYFSLSLGFITLINIPFQSKTLNLTLLGIVVLAEIARLVLTIVIHRRKR